MKYIPGWHGEHDWAILTGIESRMSPASVIGQQVSDDMNWLIIKLKEVVQERSKYRGKES